MSVEFEEQNLAKQLQYTTFGDTPKGIQGKLISWGIVRDEKSANKVLFGLTILFIILAIVFFASKGSVKVEPPQFDPPAF